MYDIRNICAARTRIGHRALRERRPPPRGTRGTVTAVACPRIFSFISLERRAAQLRPSSPYVRPAPRHAVAFLLLRPERAEGGQGEMSRPQVFGCARLRAARPSARAHDAPERFESFPPPHPVPSPPTISPSGAERESELWAVCMLGDAIHPTGPPTSSCPDLFRASPSVMPSLNGVSARPYGWPEMNGVWQGDRGRWAGPRSGPDGATAPGGDRRGGGIKVDRTAGSERATARRAEWRVGKRAELAPAVEGNGRRRFRHIFRAGFAGIKWD